MTVSWRRVAWGVVLGALVMAALMAGVAGGQAFARWHRAEVFQARLDGLVQGYKAGARDGIKWSYDNMPSCRKRGVNEL